MNMETENVTYRELFSELFENPIHPLKIHMVPPFVDESSPTFYLQIHGEKVYRCWEICGKPATVFDLLQESVKPLGYQFEESARDGIGHSIAESIRRFWRRIQATADGKRRKKIRTETWIKLAIKPEEIKLSPNDVLTKLTEENGNLRATVEEKAADLYHKMHQKMAHSGKDFTDVGKKQQYDRSTNFVELEVNVPRTIGTLRDALIGLPGIWKLLWLRKVLKIVS